MSRSDSHIPLLIISIAVLTAACGGGSGGGAVVDITPPTVIATDPPDNAVGVQVSDPIIATFSESILPASVTSSSFQVTDDMGNPVKGTVSTSGRRARFAPAPDALVKAAICHATLTTGITDLAGNPLAANSTWTFTTTTDAWKSTSDISPPTARLNHTAVWTGSEMIVWGGTDGLGMLNTGARYNPSNPDATAWTATADTVMDNAPLARTDHTAVWDSADKEMIVWGGDLSSGSTNSGGLYNPNPLTDAWMPTSAPPLVLNFLPRSLHTAVWTGTEMIVWGGKTSIGPMPDGAIYLPGTDSWKAITSNGAPVARFSHTAVWTGTEMIVWGGDPGGLILANSGGRFRVATNDWRPVSLTGAPSARVGHTAVWTGTEMIIWGGTTDGVTALNDGARYNPATDTWHPMQPAPIARSGHEAIWTRTEMIVWGGDNSDNSGAAYNPAHDTWRSISIIGEAPSGRTGHTAVWTGSEMIIWGGSDNTGPVSTGARYTP